MSKLYKMLDDQVNFEMESAHVYLSMASYCADLGLSGFENWFLVQYEEEVFHAKKLYKFLNEKGQRVIFKGFEDPISEFKNVQHVFEEALAHEKKVTKRFYDIMSEAHNEKEYSVISFIQWFIDEQVEEEDTASDIINKLKLVKDAGLYLLDQELAKRTFQPPAE